MAVDGVGRPGEVGACDDMESVVGAAVLEEGSLKEKSGTGPAECGLPKANGATVAAGAVVEIESRLSVVDEGVWPRDR